ncbi:MAG: serine hydrolase domain-containing protein, partial [Gemmatimonadota bacterium]|nr:serine hydrolase domain-containing protein [Gemmatimonadota bacterium]
MHRPLSIAALLAATCSLVVAAPGVGQTTAEFVEHLDALVPRLMEESRVPGTAVGLVEDGAVVAVLGWGRAAADGATPVGSETVFNVGSIAKSVTAWAVLTLVETGRIDLDRPVSGYLTRWEVPGASEGVTVRRLLSHTAGVSLPAVPGYRPGETVPSIEELLADPDSGATVTGTPGAEWSYSGGGYGILQLLVEEVSGRPFEAYVREAVLEPLGMRCSGFGPPGSTGCGSAAPHDTLGRPIPDLSFAMTAAAGLRTTAGDLARFLAAGLPGPDVETPGRGVLAPGSVAAMREPAPNAEQPYGIAYGLGHNLIPVPGGGRSVGHAGSNPGWAAVATAIPKTGDGIVILTNGAGGLGVYKWVLCDWVEWKAGAAYPGFCAGREARPGGILPARSAAVDSIVRARLPHDGPGAAVVVRRGGRTVHRAGYGIADLDTGRPIRPTTPFYVASVAKPLTASVIARAVERGRLEPEARLGDVLPEAPPYAAAVRTRDLLIHASGIPDYYAAIDWSRFQGLDDAAVLDTLASRPGLLFEPGARYAYSNSNYVLLSRLVEAVEGRPLGQALEATLEPLGIDGIAVDDGSRPVVAGRAIGYAPADSGGWRLSDYEAAEIPGVGTVTFWMRTTGAGGLFASAEALARWGEAWFAGRILDPAVVERALAEGPAVA